MGIVSSAAEVGSWLDDLTDERRAAVEYVRELARQSAADLHEIVYHGALGYSTSHSGHDRVVYVSIATHHLTLGFFFGAALKDPQRVLEGTGVRMRHVKIRCADDAQNPAVQQLMRQALDDGPSHTKELRLRRRSSR